MGTELPKSHESSEESDSNSDSENTSSSESSLSDWECSSTKQNSAHKPHFSVTSCDTGLKLKIAAIPRKVSQKNNCKTISHKKSDELSLNNKDTIKKKTKSHLSESSSSSDSCSKCTSDTSSDDNLPLKAVSNKVQQKSLVKNSKSTGCTKSENDQESSKLDDSLDRLKTNSKEKQNVLKTPDKNKRNKSEEKNNENPVKRGRGRPRTKFPSPAAESAACSSSTSSATSSSSSSSSSSSDSDTGSAHTSADNTNAALVAPCALQVIDDADLAVLFPEQTSSTVAQQSNFSTFSVHNTSPENDDKSIVDNGDGSSSEMEITPQLVTAAIQRATADSSGSENECSNSDAGHQNTPHYASTLLQQFVAQTQLLSSTTPITPITPAASVSCGLSTSTADSVGPIADSVLDQINSLPEINPSATGFINESQHLSPQQTEELSQINKDLEEITSVAISVTNAPSLDDCVENNDFMNLDISRSGPELERSNDYLKKSPRNLVNSEIQFDPHKLDTISTNSIESQEDLKNVIVESRRKRGRPRKVRESCCKLDNKKCNESLRESKPTNRINDFHDNDPPNVSPDSGILSNHNSPTHSPLRRHEVEDSNNRVSRKTLQKENNTNETRNMRSKSRSIRSTQNRSDSSDCDYRRKRVENEIKHIKTEAPSPVPLKQEQSKYERTRKNDHKLDIAALDRMLYATDRVLYPPRKKLSRKPQNKTKSTKNVPKTLKDKNNYDSCDSDDDSVSANGSVLSGVYAKRKELNSKLANVTKKVNKSFSNKWRENQSENEAIADDPLDPTWKQIDLNPKYKDILSGYKSDHEFKPYKSCSRLIESGYKSDYGCRSGYKTDYYRSGYKSDHKSGYKSDKSGYKTDHSIRSRRRRMKKLKKTRSVRDRSYYKNQKHFVSDQEILVLANKTFSNLTLGHTSSDSECESFLRKPKASPKYVSVSIKYPQSTKHTFGYSKLNKKCLLRLNSSDPFAPGPVFSGLQRPVTTYNIFKVNHNNNNNTFLKSPSKASYIGSPLPALKPVFAHKFGTLPVCTTSRVVGDGNKENDKALSQSPKSRKIAKNHTSPKKEISPKPPHPDIFETAKSCYIPNKSLCRNVFLNFKKPILKPSFQIRKLRRTIILAPPKIKLKPIERPSRVTVKTENKHHKHRSKRRHRSRSVSKCRESLSKSVDLLDQKFNQDMDGLISGFVKLCLIAPKFITLSQLPKSNDKAAVETVPTKVVKRNSKKRKTSDNQEISTPTTKRRHKKLLAESQSKGGKDTNEHKLPLKKRHYHINSSTNNPLSLSLVTGEFDDNSKTGSSPEKFLCTETNCLGDVQNNSCEDSPKVKSINKKSIENSKNNIHTTSSLDGGDLSIEISQNTPKLDNTPTSDLIVKIDENATPSSKNSPNSLFTTDDELTIKKPSAEQSELSKKIYETSEKLKAVHKMVHDLEKSLPKSKESEIKSESINSHKASSPKSEAKSSPIRTLTPIVTPKKRHRLEVNKVISHSSLDHVVQSLSKKLTEENSTDDKKNKDINQNNPKEDCKESDKLVHTPASNDIPTNNGVNIDPLKSMSARTLYKSSIPPAQKSEIMTRKKNRLEGLTSNLVSKINPSAATKVLDTLLNNNIRKSIESRILEKEKSSNDSPNKSNDDKSKNKDSQQVNTRATVIKSPISKGKVLETKKKPTDPIVETSIVVNVDKPTGIFEPSIDIEDQIPKSSICINNLLIESNKKCQSKPEIKNNALLAPIDTESDIPLALITETPESIIRPKRGESIAAVISDKLQENTGGHNLRQPKRNLLNENEDTNDKKKKKTSNSIIRESKLVLPTKMLVPKIQAERLPITGTSKKTSITVKKLETDNKDNSNQSFETNKKKTRRRKAINRTGFPSIKRKKKKMEPSNNHSTMSDSHFTSEDTDNNSPFERVPKSGEAMSSFLERTINKKAELKVVLNKDECPKQARLTVVALEKLQGKDVSSNNNKQLNCINKNSIPEKKIGNTSILRAPALQLKQKTDKDVVNHVNKWEVLSETDSIPSMSSSVSNDPEDSIPLSLLNVTQNNIVDNKLINFERIKRKTRAISPSQEIEEILSKRRVVEKNNKAALRPKSSLAILYPSERRLTRSSDNNNHDVKIKSNKTETKKSSTDIEKPSTPMTITTRRKSKAFSCNKKSLEINTRSRESSLDTEISRKTTSKSREPSLDTMRDHDENDPLPLNEKEIDFEKSIDMISKSVISKKRVASSRDDSPASSVDNREKPLVSKRNPRLRKKFLVAGLFSDYYKEDSRPEGKGKYILTQTEFPSGLLAPPPYCERWVRRRQQHFSLPYDIWWQQHYNQPVPSWNYKKIRTNVYYDVKPSAEECESVACNCAPSSGCNEDCINRLVFAECSPQLCPCGDKCKNQRIQRHEWASGLEKFMTENKGWGVRTKHKIKSCDFILEYVGEVVSDKEFKERMATRYARDTHHYCLHLDGGLVIDGHRMGGDGRFVNHSCRPNCEMQKWTSNGTFRMALFALRDIAPNEELTYDYNFSLFNPAVGQPCKCDSEDCRGVIGGKSQRITKMPLKTQSRTPSNTSTQSQGSNGNQPRVGRPRKAVKCNKKCEQQNMSACDIKNMTILKYQQHLNKLWQEPQMKPLTAKERNLVRDRQCFLFRNLEHVRRIRDRLSLAMTPSPSESSPPVPPPPTPPTPTPTIPSSPVVVMVNPLTLPDTMNQSIFLTRLQALRAPKEENSKKLVKLVDNHTLTKKERMIDVFKTLFSTITDAKDDKENQLCLPLLKIKGSKSQDASQQTPTDLNSIEENIENGCYESLTQFDTEINSFFLYIMREHGRFSTLGIVATQLKKIYNSVKSDYAEQLSKILGTDEPLPPGFVQKSKPEEVIMCICGLHVEEGLMVQCGGRGCGVWQHARCMRVADTRAPHYCHHCALTPVDREIPLDDYTEEGHQFYLSLMRGDLQVRQGDTVYVLRDIAINDKNPDVSQKNGDKAESPKTKRLDRKKVKNLTKGKDKNEDTASNKDGEVRKHTYQTIGEIPVSELDIFRVERLWKHKDTQERYVYGHHYLRPHETFHEPTRKFFHNEVMRVPLYEAVPIELVMSQCWVMDLNTFCKGRPVGAAQEHVYICELRVDRSARLFTRVSRPKYPICTKPYAFDHFPNRLKITRTYAPHEVLPEYLKGRGAKSSTPADKTIKNVAKDAKKKATAAIDSKKCTGIGGGTSAGVSREAQKERVNGIARRLLARGGQRAALDASYLLAPRRAPPRAKHA